MPCIGLGSRMYVVVSISQGRRRPAASALSEGGRPPAFDPNWWRGRCGRCSGVVSCVCAPRVFGRSPRPVGAVWGVWAEGWVGRGAQVGSWLTVAQGGSLWAGRVVRWQLWVHRA
eukprot:4907834-Prymnesium_polylepis.1